ncbi:MAG: hypothetical protein AAB214_11355, partial [Fibrobacterota bacterium]
RAITEAAIAHLARDGWARKFASRLTLPQACYLQEMASNHLRAWNLVEVAPGEGMLLEDIETGETIRVVERKGSVGLVAKERIAARILRDLGHPTLSHMFRITETMYDRIRTASSSVVDLETSDPREALEVALVREFARACSIPAAPARIVDAATGGLVQFVRDRFTVTNQAALDRWLDSSPELDPDPNVENAFLRFEELAGGAHRLLGHLDYWSNRGRMILELRSRSREAANDNRAWLKDRAGQWVRFTSRKIEDFEPDQSEEMDADEIGLPMDQSEVMMPEFMERIYRTHLYHNWGNTKIPALQNQTPRQCARTERGEAAVVDLVRSYQAQENHMARDQNRTPVDLSWLLAEAGIGKTT